MRSPAMAAHRRGVNRMPSPSGRFLGQFLSDLSSKNICNVLLCLSKAVKEMLRD